MGTLSSVSIEPRGDPGTQLRIGTAGWAIPKQHSSAFPADGGGLRRYAAVFNAVEINSTFYRVHRASTFERWADNVPDDFRFSVKVPKLISHEKRLVGAGREFESFVSSLSVLGSKLGPLVLQLPPKLAYDEATTTAFLDAARGTGAIELVIEPRHETWFRPDAQALLEAYGIARVGADPERAPGALQPGGSRHVTYLRLHGSPRVYFSAYDDTFIAGICETLTATDGPAWCIFDNTASGAASVSRIPSMKASS